MDTLSSSIQVSIQVSTGIYRPLRPLRPGKKLDIAPGTHPPHPSKPAFGSPILKRFHTWRFNKLPGGLLHLRPSALAARAATCARVGLALSIQNGRDPSWPPWPQVVQVRRDGCHQRPGFSSCRTRFSRQGLLQPCALCKLLHQRGTALHLHVRSAHASSNTLFLHARIAICST